MTDLVVWLWGSAGGLATTTLIFVVPRLIAYLKDEDDGATLGQIMVIVITVLLLSGIGGLGALMVNASTVGAAITAGVGTLGTLKGAIVATKETLTELED